MFNRLLFFAILASGALSINSEPRFDLQKTTNELTKLIEKTLEETGAPSMSIALVRADEIIWKAAFGYANARTKTAATTETLYNAASTFKSVTAAAILQLAEQGKLKLGDPVNAHLGTAAIRDDPARPVTFEHILSHWSGLTPWQGFTTNSAVPIWSQQALPTLEQVAGKLESIRPPGVEYQYNNSGYALAGLSVEKISGVSYETYVTENILRPLGIKTAQPFLPTPEMVEGIALPYDRDTNGALRAVAQYRTAEYPAGNAFLTAEEMARFLGAQLNGGVFQGKRILSADSVKEMQTARFTSNYGLGLRVRKEVNGNRMIRHSGSLPGMSSLMIGDVDARVGVYYMANRGDFGYKIADAAILLLRGEEYPPAPRRPFELDGKILEPIGGKYQMGSDIFTITFSERKLLLQKNDRPKRTPILAENAENFFIEDDPSTVTFEKNTDGEISRMVILDPEWQMKSAVRVK